jgi:superfamily II DNA/RNA helicase
MLANPPSAPSPHGNALPSHALRTANMIGQSQSGTGKTAAFVLTMLSRVDFDTEAPQVRGTTFCASHIEAQCCHRRFASRPRESWPTRSSRS